jgi:two-component system, OmpR family, copper resistance phosphate regulon response regulator CusR
MPKILLAEDDKVVAESVADALQINKYEVETVESGLAAEALLKESKFDMAILDRGLPEKDGLDILKDYRAAGGSIPILILTGKSAIEHRVEGLESGADDYLGKPFSIDELLARVRSLLRRPQPFISGEMQFGTLKIDLPKAKVSREGEEVSLLAKEVALLDFLLKNRGKYFSAGELLNRVWTSESESTEDAVRQCLVRLRKKIDRPGEDSLIKSSRNLGYMISAE